MLRPQGPIPKTGSGSSQGELHIVDIICLFHSHQFLFVLTMSNRCGSIGSRTVNASSRTRTGSVGSRKHTEYGSYGSNRSTSGGAYMQEFHNRRHRGSSFSNRRNNPIPQPPLFNASTAAAAPQKEAAAKATTTTSGSSTAAQ